MFSGGAKPFVQNHRLLPCVSPRLRAGVGVGQILPTPAQTPTPAKRSTPTTPTPVSTQDYAALTTDTFYELCCINLCCVTRHQQLGCRDDADGGGRITPAQGHILMRIPIPAGLRGARRLNSDPANRGSARDQSPLHLTQL